MGIISLLPLLKSITERTNIKDLQGKTVGIDAHIWLYRGAFFSGTEFCLNKDTDININYCMKKVNYLIENGVTPIVIFDGASIPMKAELNRKRSEMRQIALEKAEAARLAGEQAAAASYYERAIHISHEIARKFIKELAAKNVQFIVAPYEADAQLAYMSQQGLIDIVITDDSDSLPYCCKHVIFKFDNEGNGQEIRLCNLTSNEKPSFAEWTNSMFLDMCLLAGCDYLPKIQKIGIVTAHSLVERYRTHSLIFDAIRNKKKFTLPPDYEKKFKQARCTFRHQRVYDFRSRRMVFLMPIGANASEFDSLDFLGRDLPPNVVQGIAESRLHPVTHKPYDTPLLSVPATPSTRYNDKENHSHMKNCTKRNISTTIESKAYPEKAETSLKCVKDIVLSKSSNSHTDLQQYHQVKENLPTFVGPCDLSVDSGNLEKPTNSKKLDLLSLGLTHETDYECSYSAKKKKMMSEPLEHNTCCIESQRDNDMHEGNSYVQTRLSPTARDNISVQLCSSGQKNIFQKCIPLSAQHFTCTTVSDTLITLQRKRLNHNVDHSLHPENCQFLNWLQDRHKNKTDDFDNMELGQNPNCIVETEQQFCCDRESDMINPFENVDCNIEGNSHTYADFEGLEKEASSGLELGDSSHFHNTCKFGGTYDSGYEDFSDNLRNTENHQNSEPKMGLSMFQISNEHDTLLPLQKNNDRISRVYKEPTPPLNCFLNSSDQCADLNSDSLGYENMSSCSRNEIKSDGGNLKRSRAERRWDAKLVEDD